jgi:hypothetical protein
MIATVELYEPNYHHLKTVSKHGKVSAFKYVIKIGSLVFIKPSESSADKFLYRKGFRLNDKIQWELKFKSDDEINLERNYTKTFNLNK